MFIQQIGRMAVGAVSVVCLSLLFGCGQTDPFPGTPRLQARVSEAPNGTCMKVALPYDPLPYRVGVLHKQPSGEIFVSFNGLQSVPVGQVHLILEIIEPSPEPAEETRWVNCLKQFALRD